MPKTKAKNSETLEQKLWKSADKLRKNIGQFALAEGKKGGQFYTPESVVRVFDPCCLSYEDAN
ncbi:MAG: N-6 DNA methylase [Coleofasciculus sp. B1-GNL1-01]